MKNKQIKCPKTKYKEKKYQLPISSQSQLGKAYEAGKQSSRMLEGVKHTKYVLKNPVIVDPKNNQNQKTSQYALEDIKSGEWKLQQQKSHYSKNQTEIDQSSQQKRTHKYQEKLQAGYTVHKNGARPAQSTKKIIKYREKPSESESSSLKIQVPSDQESNSSEFSITKVSNKCSQTNYSKPEASYTSKNCHKKGKNQYMSKMESRFYEQQ